MALQELEIDHRDFQLDRKYSNDDKLYVKFFIKAHQDMTETEKVGRPIFRDAEFIQIMVPGDKENIVCRPVRELDKQRFTRRYQAWKATGADAVLIGTPLELFPGISVSQIEEVKYFGIRTVEQLAELRDDVAIKMPGFMSLKQKAMDFMEAAGKGPNNAEFKNELAKRDAEIAKLLALVQTATQPAAEGAGEPQDGAEAPPVLAPAVAPSPARRSRRKTA